jgi:hypothetical protein
MGRGLPAFVAEAEPWRGVPGLARRRLPEAEAIWPKPRHAHLDFKVTRADTEWIDSAAKDALAVMLGASSVGLM